MDDFESEIIKIHRQHMKKDAFETLLKLCCLAVIFWLLHTYA